MANNEQKQRILEHLKKSTDGVQFIVAKSINKPVSTPTPRDEPTPPPPIQPSPPKPISRKQRVITHLKLSSQEFKDFSLETKQRQQQIREHIRKTQS